MRVRVLSATTPSLPPAPHRLPTQPVCSPGRSAGQLKTVFIPRNLQDLGFAGTGDILSFGIAGQSALSDVG